MYKIVSLPEYLKEDDEWNAPTLHKRKSLMVGQVVRLLFEEKVGLNTYKKFAWVRISNRTPFRYTGVVCGTGWNSRYDVVPSARARTEVQFCPRHIFTVSWRTP